MRGVPPRSHLALLAVVALLVAGLGLGARDPAEAQVPESAPPAAPTGLTGTFTHESVSPSWDDPGDPSITGYQILRQEVEVHEPGEFIVHVDDTNSQATTHVDTSVEAATSYVYRVKARNSAGLSERSGFFRADLPAAPDTRPGLAPSNLVAQATSCSVTLTWGAPATDAATVTSYRVLRATGSEALSTLVDSTRSTATSYTDLVLQPGETYSYEVRALRDGVPSSSSNLVEAEIAAATTPTDVAVEAVPIVVTSTTADYFVLYVTHDLDGVEIETPVAVVRGSAGTTTLSENVAALPAEYYRVEKYLIANPADVDRDCTDDLTELGSPASMNPVNPARQVERSVGAVAVPGRSAFETLSLGRDDNRHLKFSVFGMDTDRPRLYFQNTENYPHHPGFLRAAGLQQDERSYRGELTFDPNMVAADGSRGVYRFWVFPRFSRTVPALALVERVYSLLAASMPLLDDNLAFWIENRALLPLQPDMPMYRASRMNLVFDEDAYTVGSFDALNPGEGYGLLRSMAADERPRSRDIVIYETLPNELPRVAGIISTVPQTPLSHVNLRAAQDRIPNAYIPDALTDAAIAPLIGSYVHYRVTAEGWQLRAATAEQVLDFYESSRPSTTQTPQRDLTVTTIMPLSQIGFHDWDAFGVKAANVAVLGTLEFPAGAVPEGFAIPFYFYDEFMKANDLYEDVREMLEDEAFQADFDEQVDRLKALRRTIRGADTPQWMIDALVAMHATYPEGQSLRYRSSTNNEDLPGFNGAGLYDSQTQKPDETEEDGIDKSLKQAFASLWNFRAFAERDFHRIDHMAAAMGVLVHPNYKDELVNGVAVSVDPAYGTEDSYYFNSQIGEDLVTNPDAYSAPEEILSYHDGDYLVLAPSNQAPSGELLMSEEQLDQLDRRLTTIHERFAALYGIAADEAFAMEIEYKITSDNVLAIKQARPWIFAEAPFTGAVPGTRTDNPLTARFEAEVELNPGVEFLVQLQFSADVNIAYEDLRDHGVEVTGASVRHVERVDYRTDFWTLFVVPEPRTTVRLYLAANRRCALRGAVCAYDGRRLAAPVKYLVPSPVPNTAPSFPTPLFAGGATGLSVPENSLGPTVAGRAPEAVDVEGDPLSYALAVSGFTTNPPFEIHAATGWIRVAVGARLDHEQRETYRVTVTAQDDLGGSVPTSFDITIEDVNDAPVFRSNTATRTVTRLTPEGANVGAPIAATDADGQTLYYSLSGPDAYAFEIDDDGQITVAPGTMFDITDRDTYAVTVEADDGNGGIATIAVTITVRDRALAQTVSGGSLAGGGGGGPTPSEVDFEWTVSRDVEELDSAHDTPSGLWSDGSTLFIAQNGSGTDDAVYAYDLESGDRVEGREFALHETNRAPRGVWSNGETAWVSDSGRERLFAYDLASGTRLEDREVELAERNRDARGIWSDGETMWVLDGRKNALFAYDLASAALLGEFELASANGDPRGIWSDGVTVWVSDHGAKRLLAYRLPAAPAVPAAEDAEDAEPVALERVRDEEFDKLSRASNNSPRGIWSDGAVMYVADASDGKVYSYNMPDAIDARLASLTLSGVDIGEFDARRTDYEGAAGEGVTQTTVVAAALQRRTTVVIDPPDAAPNTEGHQVALSGTSEITVTVTSQDGSRTRVYRVRLGEAGPSASCLRGAIAEGFSLVVYEGGSVGDLVACAQSRGVTALYALSGGEYVSYIIGAPEPVNARFGGLFADGVPALTPLVVRSESPVEAATTAPFPDADADAWPVCLRGEVAEGFSLVVYEGGAVGDLDACAESLGIDAVYVLADGAWVSYILGAPVFVNRDFAELFLDGVPAVTPLTVRRDGS